ncbi:MAG: hypothetical protein JO032_11970 [Alphaproteobacteria bacterium]|nr:hypothetical protein [Alphaproteobacteria bacterium]MBV9553498.1 hypothetical protein [Alphaproteobacteria bacterium]
MRHWGYPAIAGMIVAAAAAAQTPVGQPASEGHPSKWQATDKSLFDLIGDGYKLVTVAYDMSQTGDKAEPDVHYFLDKGNTLAKCDFRKRGQTSFYWCYQLVKAGGP